MTAPGSTIETVDAAILPVEVQLSGTLASALSGDDAEACIARAVTVNLAGVAARLGVPAKIDTRVIRDDSQTTNAKGPARDVLRLHVDGVRCRFAARLPWLARFGLTGTWPEWDALPADDPWTIDLAADGLVDLVGVICAEAVKLRPSVLLNAAAVSVYMRDVARAVPGAAELSASSEWVGEILCGVLDQRISIADTARIGTLLCSAEGESSAQIAELAIADLARDTVGVMVGNEIGVAIGSGDFGDPDDLLAWTAKGLFEETGIVFPRILVEPPTGIPEGTFAIRINDLAVLPSPLPPSGMILVNETPERLTPFVDTVLAALNPATGMPNAMAPLSAQATLEAAGYTTWTQSGYVILQLAAHLRRHIAAVVTQDQVLGQLEALEPTWPAVVRAARARLQPAALTSLLRRLAADGVPVRHLPAVLERVVDLPALELGLSRYAVLTDPVPSPKPEPPSLPREFDVAESFVRTGLGYYIAQAAAPYPGTIVAYLVSPDIEQTLVNPARSEADEDMVLSAFDCELANLPTTARIPVVLTSKYARTAMRRLLQASHPQLFVIAHEDLPPRVVVQPIARISTGD